MSKPTIDWDPLRKYPPNQVECVCGAHYLSLTKHVIHEGRFVGVSEKPCPACGRDHDHIRAARSGPEVWTLDGTETYPLTRLQAEKENENENASARTPLSS